LVKHLSPFKFNAALGLQLTAPTHRRSGPGKVSHLSMHRFEVFGPIR
jgi:hypothetical protein